MPFHLLPLDHDDGDGDDGEEDDDDDDGDDGEGEYDQWLCQPIRTGSLPRTCSSP